MAGGVFSTAKLNAMTIRESANDGSDFTNPDADYRRLFLGEDGLLHLKDSAGAVTDVGAGAASGAFVGWKVYKTTQSITNAVLAFDAEDFDSDGFHDNSTANSKATIPTGKAGKYLIVGSSWTSRTDARLEIFVNGSVIRGRGGVGTATNYALCSAILNLAEGDYVELKGVTAAATTFGDTGTQGDHAVFQGTFLGT